MKRGCFGGGLQWYIQLLFTVTVLWGSEVNSEPLRLCKESAWTHTHTHKAAPVCLLGTGCWRRASSSDTGESETWEPRSETAEGWENNWGVTHPFSKHDSACRYKFHLASRSTCSNQEIKLWLVKVSQRNRSDLHGWVRLRTTRKNSWDWSFSL